MPIVYTKLFERLKEKGYTTYKIRQEKLIGQGTLTAIKNGTGGLDAKTIARLCEVLECQPGDLMEYVKEQQKARGQGIKPCPLLLFERARTRAFAARRKPADPGDRVSG